jgi:hypothetical protein
MTRFFTVDPGGPELGWAEWLDGVLVSCGLSRCKLKGWSDRARHHQAFLDMKGAYGGLVLSECMRVRGGRNQGNPQILVELNGIAGHVGNAWVEPAAWKGMVPKETHQPRILATLSPEELALVMAVLPAGKRHNTVDAVGIGLYHLGRMVKTVAARKPRRPRTVKSRSKP